MKRSLVSQLVVTMDLLGVMYCRIFLKYDVFHGEFGAIERLNL